MHNMVEPQGAFTKAQLNRFSELLFSQKSSCVGWSCKGNGIDENSYGCIPRLLFQESSYHKKIDLYKQFINRHLKIWITIILIVMLSNHYGNKDN